MPVPMGYSVLSEIPLWHIQVAGASTSCRARPPNSGAAPGLICDGEGRAGRRTLWKLSHCIPQGECRVAMIPDVGRGKFSTGSRPVRRCFAALGGGPGVGTLPCPLGSQGNIRNFHCSIPISMSRCPGSQTRLILRITEACTEEPRCDSVKVMGPGLDPAARALGRRKPESTMLDENDHRRDRVGLFTVRYLGTVSAMTPSDLASNSPSPVAARVAMTLSPWCQSESCSDVTQVWRLVRDRGSDEVWPRRVPTPSRCQSAPLSGETEARYVPVTCPARLLSP